MGNPNTTIFTSYGCPVYSSGESFYSEMTLVRAKGAVLSWLEEAHRAGKGYANPELEVTFADEPLEETPAWVDDPDAVGPNAAAVSAAGGSQWLQEARGMEIIPREDWETWSDREEKQDVPEPDNVYVVGKSQEED